MDPKRWTVVNRIFHAAIEMPASDRDGFVSTASEGDAEIEQNVMRLLNADSEADSYLETPLVPAYLGIDSSPAPFEPGRILKERFRIERHVGQGGMGHVFEASDLDLKVRVALKVIRPEIASNPAALEYFRREVRTARTITHINVCRTYDLDRYTVGSGTQESRDLYFLTMEFLEGETLAQRIRREGPFTTGEAHAIACQIAAGLNSAHTAGVIHRDLKPANIMLVPAAEAGTMPRAVIMDFGLARRDPITADGSVISHGSLVGTLAYMAPEQLDPGAPVSAATDVYAFGLILFEMVAGQRAYPSTGLLSGIAQRISGSSPSAKALVPGVPDAWERAIEGCLRPDGSDRLQSAAEVIEVLEDHTPAPSGKTKRRAVSRSAQPAWGLLRRWPLAAALAAGLVGVSLFGVWLRLIHQRGNSRLTPGALVYLAPVRNQTGEKALDNLTELLQEGLNQSVQINLLDQGRVGDTLQLMTKPPDTPITEPIAREIAMRTGAVRVVFPTLTSSNGTYTLRIDIQQPENTPTSYREHWPADFAWRTSGPTAGTGTIPLDLSSAVRKASDWIRYEAGESRNDIARLDLPPQDVTTSKWEALEAISRAAQSSRMGRRQDAISSLHTAIQNDPACAFAYARLADLEVQSGDLGDGLSAYLTAIDLGATNRLSQRERDYIRGIYALDTGNYQAAEDAFREYTALYESDYSGWFYRALPLSMLGRFDEAIQVSKKAHEVAPERAGAVGMLVGESLILGDSAGAENWRNQLKLIPNSEDSVHFSDAEIAISKGDLNTAREAIGVLETSASPAIRTHAARYLAHLAAEQGDYPEAARILTGAIQKYGSQPLILSDRAHAECLSRDLVSCLRDIESAIEADNSPQMLLRASETLGQSLVAEPEAKRATIIERLKDLERRLTSRDLGLLGEDARHRLHGETLLAEGQVAAALEEFRKSDSLEGPYVGREYLGRAFEVAASQQKSDRRACEELRSSMRAYAVSALHPAIIWELHDLYPPGYYSETLSKWMQLSAETNRADSDYAEGIKEWGIFRSTMPAPKPDAVAQQLCSHSF
jgi:eukaryotic-like serine/threonine-protein kinase